MTFLEALRLLSIALSYSYYVNHVGKLSIVRRLPQCRSRHPKPFKVGVWFDLDAEFHYTEVGVQNVWSQRPIQNGCGYSRGGCRRPIQKWDWHSCLGFGARDMRLRAVLWRGGARWNICDFRVCLGLLWACMLTAAGGCCQSADVLLPERWRTGTVRKPPHLTPAPTRRPLSLVYRNRDSITGCQLKPKTPTSPKIKVLTTILL